MSSISRDFTPQTFTQGPAPTTGTGTPTTSGPARQQGGYSSILNQRMGGGGGGQGMGGLFGGGLGSFGPMQGGYGGMGGMPFNVSGYGGMGAGLGGMGGFGGGFGFNPMMGGFGGFGGFNPMMGGGFGGFGGYGGFNPMMSMGLGGFGGYGGMGGYGQFGGFDGGYGGGFGGFNPMMGGYGQFGGYGGGFDGGYGGMGGFNPQAQAQQRAYQQYQQRDPNQPPSGMMVNPAYDASYAMRDNVDAPGSSGYLKRQKFIPVNETGGMGQPQAGLNPVFMSRSPQDNQNYAREEFARNDINRQLNEQFTRDKSAGMSLADLAKAQDKLSNQLHSQYGLNPLELSPN